MTIVAVIIAVTISKRLHLSLSSSADSHRVGNFAYVEHFMQMVIPTNSNLVRMSSTSAAITDV